MTATRSDTLLALADRVEAGEMTPGSAMIQAMHALGMPTRARRGIVGWINLGGILEAVSAFQEAVLPGSIWISIQQCCEHAGWENERWFWRALISTSSNMVWSMDAPTEPAARLAALLRALAVEADCD